MAYLGRKGASAALTSADIPDSSITTAKIVDGTVAEGDLAFSTATQAELDAQRTNSSITTLGTVTAGNLSSEDIVMPRIKEYDKYYYPTTTTTSTSNDDAVNISGSNSVALTPEHTGDLFEFSWRFCMSSNGYSGHGVQRATNSAFTSGVATQWSTGRHTWGNFSGASLDFVDSAGSITVDATGLSAGTTYYFRLIGMTHSTTASHHFGSDATNSTNGIGIHFSAKRWSIV